MFALSRRAFLHPSLRQFQPLFNKTMASATTPAKHEWIVILPDHEGALPRRMEVRPQHLENLKPQVESNFWLMGGAFMEDVPKEGEGLKLKGSVMLALAESKEDVMEQLKNDVYCKNNVWDMDKIQIYPFRTAFRKSSNL